MKLTPVRSATTRRTPERAALKKLSLNFTAVVMSASPSTAMTKVPVSGASSRRAKDAVWVITDAFLCGLNQSAAAGSRTEEAIKQAYRDCTPTDKGAVYMNAHVLAWIRHAMPSDVIKRANVIVMLNTGSVAQYDATAELQRQLYDAHGAAALPEPLRAALRAMSFTGKLSFFRFGDEAFDYAVNPLQDPVKREVIAILRVDREP